MRSDSLAILKIKKYKFPYVWIFWVHLSSGNSADPVREHLFLCPSVWVNTVHQTNKCTHMYCFCVTHTHTLFVKVWPNECVCRPMGGWVPLCLMWPVRCDHAVPSGRGLRWLRRMQQSRFHCWKRTECGRKRDAWSRWCVFEPEGLHHPAHSTNTSELLCPH